MSHHHHDEEDSSEETVYDSTSPLLEANRRNPKPTPIPKLSLAAVCLARLVDPVSFSQIFPYVNEFMSRLGVTDDEDKIGFYSGFVESAFAFCQLLSIYRWAKLSDTIGRRPVIMLGMVGLAVGSIGLGLSRSLAGVIIFRCLGGLFSGNVAAVHAAAGELSDPTNQHIIFPLYGLFWPLGSIVGPMVGGALANPATSLSKTLFDSKFWRQYPYFLPCLVSAVLVLLSVLFSFFFLEETHPKKRKTQPKQSPHVPGSSKAHGRSISGSTYGSTTVRSHSKLSTSSSESFSSSVHDQETTKPEPQERHYSVKDLLSITVIRALCASGLALCFLATSFDVVFVLFCYSTVASGGLGFNPSQIGTGLAVSGFVQVVLQVAAMPPLLKRVHAGKMYMICMWVWPFAFALLPVLNIIARNGGGSLGKGRNGGLEVEGNPTMEALLMAGVTLTLALSRIGSLGYSLSLILVKQYAPNAQVLASTNGLVQFAMCVARSIAPAFISSAFAISIDKKLLGGNLWVVIILVICIIGCWVSRQIPRSKSAEEDVNAEIAQDVNIDGNDDNDSDGGSGPEDRQEGQSSTIRVNIPKRIRQETTDGGETAYDGDAEGETEVVASLRTREQHIAA